MTAKRAPRKPVVRRKPAKRRPVPEDTHPPECDYPRYAGQRNRMTRMSRTFDRTAKLLGEVEAGLDAFYRIAHKHGLLAVPDGGANICSDHLAVVHTEAENLTKLLSHEAKLLIPVIFMLVGDQAMAKVMGVELDEDGEETVH